MKMKKAQRYVFLVVPHKRDVGLNVKSEMHVINDEGRSSQEGRGFEC